MSFKANRKSEASLRKRFGTPIPQYFALANEFIQIGRSLVAKGGLGASKKLSKFLLVDSALESPFSEKRLLELVGDIILDLFVDLGPVYGKAAQVAMTRMGLENLRYAEKLQLDRLYSDWPAMPFDEVSDILDDEIPDWHQDFLVEPHPIGVASMAQVHTAIDEDGMEWAIKVVKPQARKRLHETLDALQQIVSLVKPLEVTPQGRRIAKEIRGLIAALRNETNLLKEKENLQKMTGKLAKRKNQVVRLPKIKEEFCTESVLTIEKFTGVSLADIVSQRLSLSPVQRKSLAKKVLKDLLIQVFELGLFHGDPHGGNLILLDDGSVGIFDWGLTGDLSESDRHFVSQILKALVSFDRERLVSALFAISLDHGQEIRREDINDEIDLIVADLGIGGEKPKKVEMALLFEKVLASADKLGIPIPEGLLLMIKSLLTIEGLARGIDPGVSLGKIAMPLLWRAAKPQWSDVVEISKNLPRIAGQWLHRDIAM